MRSIAQSCLSHAQAKFEELGVAYHCRGEKGVLVSKRPSRASFGHTQHELQGRGR